MSLIGSLLFDPDRYDEVIDIMSGRDFILPDCGRTFEAIGSLRSEGQAVDVVTVWERLTSRKSVLPEQGEQFLIDCLEKVPHAAHAKHYAEIVRDKSLRRQAISACTDAIRDAHGDTGSIEDAIGNVESRLHSILERVASRVETNIGSLLIEALSKVGTTQAFGISSGFPSLDKMTNGWQPGSLNVLAARPSVGKTALAIRWLMNSGRDSNHSLFMSLEQSRAEVSERILSMESHIPVDMLRKSDISDQTRDTIMANANVVGSWPIDIDDTPGRTVTTIGAIARLSQRRYGTKLMLIDYLQLVEPNDRRVPREQQVAEISRGLKRIARELKIAVICLAQLNRQIESRTDRKPQLSDLRESGSIEQDADTVLMIDRPGSYDTNADKNAATLFLRKNRNGVTGEIDLNWNGPTMEFREGVGTMKYPEMEEQESRYERGW